MPESFSCEKGHSSYIVLYDSPVVLYYLLLYASLHPCVNPFIFPKNTVGINGAQQGAPWSCEKDPYGMESRETSYHATEITDKRLSVIISFLNPL